MSNMLIACTACLRIRLPTRFAMHFAHTHTETVIVEFVIIFIGLTVHIVLARRTYISYVHITRCLLVLRSLCCLCSCSKLSSNNIWARVFIVRAASCACPRSVTFQIRQIPNTTNTTSILVVRTRTRAREMTNRVVCLCHVYEHTIRSRIARRGTCCLCSAPHILTTTISTKTARFRFSILFLSIRK